MFIYINRYRFECKVVVKCGSKLKYKLTNIKNIKIKIEIYF